MLLLLLSLQSGPVVRLSLSPSLVKSCLCVGVMKHMTVRALRSQIIKQRGGFVSDAL